MDDHADAAETTPTAPLPPNINPGLIYGDVLEAIIARVPTTDLISASRVSREWHSAVRSSLTRHPRRSPWLIVRQHLIRRTSSSVNVYAFDPFSSSWASLQSNPNGRVTTFLRGSAGDRLHAVTVSKLAISEDPFGAVWREEIKAPKIWRQDAVVAELGRWIVVAGGGCPMALHEGEAVGAVEVYDGEIGDWESAEPMPPRLDGSASATWLSAAASGERVHVVEKKSGLIGSFDPKCKRWGPICRPINPDDPTVQSWAIAIGRDHDSVLLVGVDAANPLEVKVKLWEVNSDTMKAVDDEEEMPREMVQHLFPIEDDDAAAWCSFSVEVLGTEHGGYVYNSSEMERGAVLYEFGKGEEEEEEGGMVRRWEWVPLPERAARGGTGRVEFGCSAVRLGDLAAAFSINN